MFDCLAVDWGEKRSGIAIGDSETGLILPLDKEVFTENLILILEKEISQRKIKKIILGLPTNFFLKDTSITSLILEFENSLKEAFPSLEIETINERSSTKDARSKLASKPTKHEINHQAAAIILEYYFEKKKLIKL